MRALAAISLLLSVLTLLAAPVSIIWLIFLDHWWAVGIAFASLFSHFLLGIALLPAMAFSIPAAALSTRRPTVALLLGLLSHFYTAALITIWCMSVLTYLLSRATPDSWIPLMLLAFSIGTAPWVYMAQKESQGGGGEGSIIATFFTQLAFSAVMLAIVVLRPPSMAPLWVIFGTIMTVEVCVATASGLAFMRAEATNDPVHQIT